MILRAVIASTLLIVLIQVACSGTGDDVTGSGSATISVSNGSATEGGAINFSVKLSKVITDDVVFSYVTTNGTAQSGLDYQSASGTDTIDAGSATQIVVVTTLDDAIVESSESFTISLNSVVNANVSGSVGTGTIIDNDGAVSVLFSSDVRPILVNQCAISGCHGTGSSSGGYSMGSVSYSEVRTASGDHGSIISPGDASASNLYLKTTATPPFLSRMPLGRAPLSTADQEKIRDWINEGAVDN